jgi:biotin carboxylase
MTRDTQRPVVAFLNLRRTPTEQQGPLKAAQALGVEVILLGEAIPAGLSPEVVVASRRLRSCFDEQEVLTALAEELGDRELRGVVTWSDAAVQTVARVAQAYGLPGQSPESADICRDKSRMREALAARHPTLCPRFARVREWGETLRASRELTFPLVLKPVSGSGSKGIYRVADETELRAAHRALTELVDPARDPIFTGHHGDLILEEFMTGSEHSVEGVVHEGRVTILGVTDKRTNEPFRLETGHVFPSQLPAGTLAAVHDLTHAVVASFGMDDCTFHLECIIGPDGTARLVECAGRGAGDFILSDLVGLATGAPGCTDALRVALGQEPRPGRPFLVAGLRKIMAEAEGTLRSVEGVDAALRVPGVEKIVLERPLQAAVQLPPRDFASSVIGAVIATAPTAAEVEAILDEAVGLITPVVTP